MNFKPDQLPPIVLLPSEMFSKIMSSLTLRDRINLIRAWPEAGKAAQDPRLSRNYILGDEDLGFTREELGLLFHPTVKQLTISLKRSEDLTLLKYQFLCDIAQVMPELEMLTLINCSLALMGKQCGASTNESPCIANWNSFPASLKSLIFKHCAMYTCQYCGDQDQARPKERQCFSKLFNQE